MSAVDAVVEMILHLLSGESCVGDGALAELWLQGKPKNKTKATDFLLLKYATASVATMLCYLLS